MVQRNSFSLTCYPFVNLFSIFNLSLILLLIFCYEVIFSYELLVVSRKICTFVPKKQQRNDFGTFCFSFVSFEQAARVSC